MKGQLLGKLSTAYRDQRNACRVVRSLVRRTPGVSLKLQIDVCEVHVRLRKPVRCLKVWWPMLRLDKWTTYLLGHKPQLLLGGQQPDDMGNWKRMYYDFWGAYKLLCPDHPIFESGFDVGGCLPYFVHGDEGRGQLKRPYMCISWQLAIGHLGPQVCNDTSYLGSYGTCVFSS